MKYAFVIYFFALFCAVSMAQPPSKSQQLNQSVAELYQAGKYDEAIPLAEEVVGLERKASNGKNLISAIENLAQIRVARFTRLVAELNAGTVDPGVVKSTLEKLKNDADGSEANLREAIRLADANQNDLSQQRIAMRNSLAWLLYNYQSPDPEVSVGFDKTARDKFEMRTRARYYKRINEAESLYQEALKIASAGANTKDGAALLTTYNFAEFALATGNLEDAIARFENCLAEVEKIYGKKSPSLVQPLESYVKALVASGQDDLAFENVSRLVRVTGKSAGMPKALLNLSLRSDRAFAPTNATGVEDSARANKERATLSGRAATVNASLDAILAVSTHGRQYYDNALSVKVVNVPVRVVVDETGRVVEAEALVPSKELKNDAETAVKAWKFRPLVIAGQPRKIKGYVEAIILADRTTK